jgi:ubiquinone/menaquinone biosynthesis C-methylase UbiE
MARETSKTWGHRNHLGDFNRYLHGKGIDIGCGDDILHTPANTVTGWDLPQGDATFMAGVPDSSFDFVYSSHCLEHLADVKVALDNWFRICKQFGFVYFVIPEYRMYEKCRWPSSYNGDHKSSFSLHMTRQEVGRDNHYHIYYDLLPLVSKAKVMEVRYEYNGYDFGLGDEIDQTLHRNALCQLCVILQKVAP